MKKLRFTTLILISFLLFFNSCSSSSTGGGISHPGDYKAKDYLKEYFDIEVIPPDTPSYLFLFKENLKKIIVDYNNEGEDVLDIALSVTDNDYLVNTYNKAKIKRRKTWYYNSEIKGIAENKYFALLDSGLLRGTNFQDGKIDENNITLLLMNIATIKGQTRRYVGFINDENIAANVLNVFKSYYPFRDKELEDVGFKLIKENKIKEFSIKRNVYNAKFLSKDTLYYSGKNISEIPRIINTLFSEGINARVQIEPRMFFDNNNKNGELLWDLVFEFSNSDYKKMIPQILETCDAKGVLYNISDVETVYGGETSLTYTKV